MTTITIGTDEYQIGRLDAKKQFHVGRRLMPVQAAMGKAAKEMQAEADPEAAMAVLMSHASTAVAQMPEADVDYVLDTCLGVVSRRQGDRYAGVMVRGQMMFQDITMELMLRLTVEVIKENMGSFFGMLTGASA